MIIPCTVSDHSMMVRIDEASEYAQVVTGRCYFGRYPEGPRRYQQPEPVQAHPP